MENERTSNKGFQLNKKLNVITLLKPYLGNNLLANYNFLKHPLTNLILSSLSIPKVLKKCRKNYVNWFTNEN